MAGSGVNISSIYTDKKISKIRWNPLRTDRFDHALKYFVTGSWDNDVTNVLELWKYESQLDQTPTKLHQLKHTGDVTSLEFLSDDVLLSGSSQGHVSVYKKTNNDKLELCHTWNDLHKNGKLECSSCSDISCFENEVITVGEDGNIIVLTVDRKEPLRSIDDAESCNILCVKHLSYNTIMTSNCRGHIKMWNIRNCDQTPIASVMANVAVTALARHPTQNHVIASGQGDGTVFIWDTRQLKFAVREHEAHSEQVNEIHFNESFPNILFSCSLDGGMFLWNSSADSGGHHFGHYQESYTSPWLSPDSAQCRLDIVSLLPSSFLPINTSSCMDNLLLCAGDNEMLSVISGFN